MARLKRESSNSLFEVLEGWEAYLQAENLDIGELSQNAYDDTSTDPDSVEKSGASDKLAAQVKVRRSAQRLVP